MCWSVLAACSDGTKGSQEAQPDAGSTECTDDDADGFCDSSSADGANVDCDDYEARRNPAAKDTCNGMDDDCDSKIDEGGAACAFTCDAPAGGCEKPVQLVAGESHACVRTNAGTVYCWGSNADGQLGIGEVAYSARPVLVPGVRGATSLIAGAEGACSDTEQGLVCWGMGWGRPLVVPVPTDVTIRALTRRRLCWVDTTGSLFCLSLWPGSGAEIEQLTTEVEALAAGSGRVCALLTDGSVQCYEPGTSEPGPEELAASGVDELFIGYDGRACFVGPSGLTCDGKVIPGNDAAIAVRTSATLACALAASGQVACWEGEAPAIDDATQLAVGQDFACVLTRDERIGCWGARTDGALGDGELSSRASFDTLVAPFGGPAYPGVPQTVLATQSPLGKCDNFADLNAIASNPSVHSAVSSCLDDCDGTLDPDTCLAECTNGAASPECVGCFVMFAGCTQASGCHAALTACAGFAPDFIEAHDAPPDFACVAGGCLTDGNPHGAPCTQNEECLSRECSSHPLATGTEDTICLARSGASCFSGATHCDCRDNNDFCGYCTGEGRAGSASTNFSERDGCHRECTDDQAICAYGTQCRQFADSNRKYCD